MEPRHILVSPPLFGTSHVAPAVLPLPDELLSTAARWASAYQQHLFALGVRSQMSSHGTNMTVVAKAIGWDPGTFRKKMKGQQWMRPEEMYSLAVFFADISMLAAHNAVADLLPVGLDWPADPRADSAPGS